MPHFSRKINNSDFEKLTWMVLWLHLFSSRFNVRVVIDVYGCSNEKQRIPHCRNSSIIHIGQIIWQTFFIGETPGYKIGSAFIVARYSTSSPKDVLCEIYIWSVSCLEIAMFLDGNRQHGAAMLGVIAGENIFYLPCSIETLTLCWSQCHLSLTWCLLVNFFSSWI